MKHKTPKDGARNFSICRQSRHTINHLSSYKQHSYIPIWQFIHGKIIHKWLHGNGNFMRMFTTFTWSPWNLKTCSTCLRHSVFNEFFRPPRIADYMDLIVSHQHYCMHIREIVETTILFVDMHEQICSRNHQQQLFLQMRWDEMKKATPIYKSSETWKQNPKERLIYVYVNYWPRLFMLNKINNKLGMG